MNRWTDAADDGLSERMNEYQNGCMNTMNARSTMIAMLANKECTERKRKGRQTDWLNE